MANTIIQTRNDTAANWTSSNPVLAQGEMGIESDTRKFKFGDGSTAWTSLNYANNISNSFKYGLYTLSADQTSNFAVGNHIEFDTVQGSLGGLSTGSGQQRGIVTLQGGKTYKITATCDIGCSSTGYGVTQIYDRTNSTYVGVVQGHPTNNATASEASKGHMMAIISPSSNIDIDFRFEITSGNWTTIYSNSSFMLIEEYGGY